MRKDEVVTERSVDADMGMTTILRARVYFDFRVTWKFVDVSGCVSRRRRSPSGDRVGTCFVVEGKFVGGIVGRRLEGAGRMVGVHWSLTTRAGIGSGELRRGASARNGDERPCGKDKDKDVRDEGKPSSFVRD
jgi:hypothetical protein